LKTRTTKYPLSLQNSNRSPARPQAPSQKPGRPTRPTVLEKASNRARTAPHVGNNPSPDERSDLFDEFEICLTVVRCTIGVDLVVEPVRFWYAIVEWSVRKGSQKFRCYGVHFNLAIKDHQDARLFAFSGEVKQQRTQGTRAPMVWMSPSTSARIGCDVHHGFRQGSGQRGEGLSPAMRLRCSGCEGGARYEAQAAASKTWQPKHWDERSGSNPEAAERCASGRRALRATTAPARMNLGVLGVWVERGRLVGSPFTCSLDRGKLSTGVSLHEGSAGFWLFGLKIETPS
jgi:hypothetical protein